MGLRLSRMRRNVTRIVYNARKNVSATAQRVLAYADDHDGQCPLGEDRKRKTGLRLTATHRYDC